MLIRGFKSHIAVNMSILLLFGMLLINIVTVKTAQREMFESEVKRVNLFFTLVEQAMKTNGSHSSYQFEFKANEKVSHLLKHFYLDGTLFINTQGEKVFVHNKKWESNKDLLKISQESIQKETKVKRFYGTTWGVLWKQSKYLMISSPIVIDKRIVGGFGIVLSLEDIYKSQRISQKVLWIYIIINTIILTLIGIYRLTKVYLIPMKRLVKRANEYKDEDDIFFSVRKEDDELNQLSTALNRMLEQISKDKKKLRFTVDSLEKTNAQLKLAQREIVQAEKLASIGRLTSGIAHEIGNPIGIIIGYLELLKQKGISENEKNDYIRRTQEEINRVNLIIRQLLDLSRPAKIERKAVSVHKIIMELSDVIKSQPFMKNIELNFELNASKDSVKADPNQLRQIFLNIAINAADAIVSNDSSENGILLFKSLNKYGDSNENSNEHDHNQNLKIMLIDNGPGIPEDDLDNIFDPFFTTKEPGKGTGLGLWVNFMIIEGMNGNISVHSRVGEGTTVIIEIPLYADN